MQNANSPNTRDSEPYRNEELLDLDESMEQQNDPTMSDIDKEIEDFMAGSYVPKFEVGEERVYKFDKSKTQIVPATDFNGKPIKKIQYTVKDANDPSDSWKKWGLVRIHRSVWDELKKGYSVLRIRREGQAKQTRYVVKGIR